MPKVEGGERNGRRGSKGKKKKILNIDEEKS